MSSSPDFSTAFDWVRRHVAAERLPSAVLGVASADGILALDAFGTAASGTGASVTGATAPVTVDTRYPLFSVTKPLVGIAAARAIEAGRLTLQTPLTAALPQFGSQRDDVVRLAHLASHTSGITEPPLDTAVPLRTELLTRGRDFAAGTMSRYSTIAFEGIAALLEHVEGRPWDAAVAEAMTAVGAEGISLDPADAVSVPDAADAGLDLAAFHATRAPGAGLFGTATDLLRVGSDLLRIHGGARDGIVRPATLAMMLRPLTGDIPRLEPYPAARGQDWGFTWNLRTRAPGLIDRDAYGHGGWAGAEFWVHPSAGLAWVLLTHRALRPGVDPDELGNAIISA